MHFPEWCCVRGYRRCSLWLWVVSPLGLLVGAPASAQTPPSQSSASRASKPVAPAAKDPVEQHYQAAETFQLTGDFRSAETEYRRTISLALQRLAATRVLARDSKQAISMLRAATSADPGDLDAQMSLAAAYFESGELANAKSLLTEVLAKDERRPGAKSLLGKVFFLEGNYAQAAEQLQASLADDSNLDTAYSLALCYLRLGKVSEASNVFDEMLTALGSSAELHVLIGRAYQDGNQPELAAEEFRKALQLDPRTVRAHAYLGSILMQQPSDAGLAEALGEFQAELAHNPADYSSHLNLGIIFFKRSEFGLAAQEFSKAVAIRPDSAEARLRLGQAQLAAGKLPDAVKALEKAVQLDDPTGNARLAHQALSEALAKLGERDRSLREARIAQDLTEQEAKHPAGASTSARGESRAILTPLADSKNMVKIPPRYIDGLKEALGNAYHNLGVILAQRSQYAEASLLFSEAAKWAPRIKSLDRNWGIAAFRAQQYQAAIEPLQRQVNARPEDSTARQMLALSYFMVEDFTKASANFRPILSTIENNPSLSYAAGVSLAKTGDARGASELFQKMLASNPNAAEVHLFLAQAYADQKQDEDAGKEFARAIELNPKLAGAHYGAGMLEFRKGNLDGAERYFRDELALNPGDVSTEFRLGYVLLTKRKTAEAIELLSAVVQQKPEDADARYELGKAMLEHGDLKAAIASLEKAKRLEPREPYAYYQLSLAYRRDGRVTEADASLREYERLKQEGSTAGKKSEE